MLGRALVFISGSKHRVCPLLLSIGSIIICLMCSRYSVFNRRVDVDDML
jgi:hypothetical protein